MELDPVEARLLRAPRGVREEAREAARQLADRLEVDVRHALARAEAERLELALGQEPVVRAVVEGEEPHPEIRLGSR